MPLRRTTVRLGTVAAAAIGAIGLCALAVPTTANAQTPYLGWDFGNGVGIGLGAPPSAYGMSAESPLAPFAPFATPYYHPYYPRYYYRY